MIYVFWDSIVDGRGESIRCIYKESLLTPEQKAAAHQEEVWPPVDPPKPPDKTGFAYSIYRDLTNNVWAWKSVPVPITPLQFRNLFTMEEKVALKTAITDPVDKATLEVIMDDLNAASEIDLSHPRLTASMDWMVSKNLITAERRDEILGIA